MSVPIALILCAVLVGVFLAVITRIVNLRIVVPALIAVFLIVGLGINITPAVGLLEDITTNLFGVTP